MYENWAHSIYHITGKYNTKENGDTSYYFFLPVRVAKLRKKIRTGNI